MQQGIDACIQLNQWNLAIDLAKKHNVREIDALLVKYAELLLDKKKLFNAVELYRNANHYLEAAKLLYKVEYSSSYFYDSLYSTRYSTM